MRQTYKQKMNMTNTLTETQQKAFHAFHQCPIPINKFFELCDFLLEAEPDEVRSTFQRTLQFIDTHRLIKSKLLKWLSANGVSSDCDVIKHIAFPLYQRFDEFRREEMDADNYSI